ncbi:MAG TPA: HD-GYP domain-containing protein [Burkholderiaceae bacterium]|nr:HD-GYP domain-containing protein [Burkholderiaceae bacterium]
MLKRIDVNDLRLGMYLHALDGPWLDHPFWRNKFRLEADSDLQAMRRSGLKHCWIDSAKGLDVAVAVAVAPPPAAGVVDLAAPAERPRAPAATSFEDELQHAAQLCRKARGAVRQLFAELRMGKALNAEAMQPLVEELTASVFRNPGALVSLARLKTKDDYTYMHSVAVCALMVALARELGFDVAACREAGLAGLLHDVGKAMMPLDVLTKPGKLTEAEFAVMRAHPERGHALLIEGGSAGSAALDVCLHHHERVDGKGYPHRLVGAAIGPLARMGAICDVYDAISSARPYKSAWDPAESLSRMASWEGHFDPPMFASFVRSLGIYPTGSLVRLRSGRLAVVVKQHAKDLIAPTVKAFFSTRSNLPTAVTRLDLSRPDAGDVILRREPRDAWNFPHLETLWAGDAAPR